MNFRILSSREYEEVTMLDRFDIHSLNQQECDIMNIRSRRRNPVLADIFSHLNYMERRGSGFKKICNSKAISMILRRLVHLLTLNGDYDDAIQLGEMYFDAVSKNRLAEPSLFVAVDLYPDHIINSTFAASKSI